MIQLSSNMWVYRDDLARPLPHRHDDSALIEDCIEYFSRHAQPRRAVGASREQETQGHLVAARVKASVGRRPAATSSDLEERLRQASATIDRLLAFVPARVKPIAGDRLGEIAVRATELLAGQLGHQVTPLLEPEDSPDTEACHRLSLLVGGMDDVDSERAASGIRAMHKLLAKELTSDEYRALRVIVVPR